MKLVKEFILGLFIVVGFMPFICNGMEADDNHDLNKSLRKACKPGYINITEIESLINARANVNQAHSKYRGNTPLLIVAFNTPFSHDLEAMKLLIKHNANVNQQDDCGKSPLDWAAGIVLNEELGISGNIEAVKLLILHGAIVIDKHIELAKTQEMKKVLRQAQAQEKIKLVSTFRLFSKFEFNKLFYSNQF